MSRYPNVRGKPRVSEEDRARLAAYTIERSMQQLKRTQPEQYASQVKRVNEYFARFGGERADRMIRAMEAIIDQGERDLLAAAAGARPAGQKGHAALEMDDQDGRATRPRVSAGEMLRASKELRVWMDMRDEAWRQALLAFAVDGGFYDTLMRELDEAERELQAPRADAQAPRPMPQPRAPAA